MEKKEGVNYMHYRVGDIVKVEIRDETYRIIYKKKFNMNSKKDVLEFLSIVEKFGKFSVIELIREKAKIGEWF